MKKERLLFSVIISSILLFYLGNFSTWTLNNFKNTIIEKEQTEDIFVSTVELRNSEIAFFESLEKEQLKKDNIKSDNIGVSANNKTIILLTKTKIKEQLHLNYFEKLKTKRQKNNNETITKQHFLQIELKNFKKQEIVISKIEFVFINAGGVTINYDDENDNNLDVDTNPLKDYYISKFEITNSQYAEFLNDYHSDLVKKSKINTKYTGKVMIRTNKKFGLYKKNNIWVCKKGKENFPVTRVTWYGANQYCIWLSKKMGEKYDLPTKKQWIYAASEGKSIPPKFSGTQNKKKLSSFAWYINNTFNQPHEVGKKQANSFGIYDMTGNVKEWCYSYIWSETKLVTVDNGEYYSDSEEYQKTVYDYAVLRGGGWADSHNACEIIKSPSYQMNYNSKDAGFRICKFNSKNNFYHEKIHDFLSFSLFINICLFSRFILWNTRLL